MRKVSAWLGVATLFMLMSRADAANDVLKPYVVMILDTSGSMAAATGSGPTSCGKRDTRLNHAVCAINNIVNSYGEMVFSLGRFRETTSGTVGAGQSCDANGDQEGNFGNGTSGTLPAPSGGDVCNTQGPYCGDCNPENGLEKACADNVDCTFPNQCAGIAAESGAQCSNNLDDDNDGRINDGCPIVAGTREGNTGVGAGTNPQCYDNVDNDSDGTVNDGCPAFGQCDDQTDYGCKNGVTGGTFFNNSAFEVLTPLVDGNNAQAAEYTDGSCNTCAVGNTAGAIDPEIWGISRHTFTPLSASLAGAQLYWQGDQFATDNSGASIWPASTDGTTNNPGYDPINRDPAAHVYLTKGGTSGIANQIGNGVCNPTDTCDPSGGCTGGNCCCVSQCRPYITILLTDGAETCTAFSNTELAATNLATNVDPRSDQMAIDTASRTGDVVTLTTPASALPHPFKVGDQIRVTGSGIPQLTGQAYIVTAVPGIRTLQYKTVTSGTVNTITNTMLLTSFAAVQHTADIYNYKVQVIPIGFGIAPGDPQIEGIAHAGGAADVPNANEGYYAQDEADLELAISQILADSVRAETCNDRDDDCDTRIDEDFPTKGATCTEGVGACLDVGVLVCSAGSLECNAQAGTPTQEICNSIDDDCDGFVDETSERGAECLNNLANDDVTDGVVNDGCPVVGSPETGAQCTDAVDSDGDGVINDGCPAVGSCTSCVPTAEICDDKDNDCDGVVNQSCRCSGGSNANGVCDGTDTACTGGGTCVCTPITRPCGVGVCAGVETCVADNVYTGCTAQPATDEQCDGLDNDCDGICDGFTLECSDMVTPGGPGSDNPGHPNHNPPPTIPQNICQPGTKTCPLNVACSGTNSFGACSGEIKPCNGQVPCIDTCNGLDDDCDNSIDEDFQSADCSTNCGLGSTVCQNGQIVCNSQAAEGDATCDNNDDDCDGKFDEDWECEDQDNNGQCDPCGVGQVCNGMQKCVNGNPICDGGAIGIEVCNCMDDDCDGDVDEDPDPNDPNNNICPSGGQCVNCQCAFGCAVGEFPCPLGKKCETSTDPNIPGNFCVNDPCFNITCPAVNGNLQTCIQDPNQANAHQCVDVCSLINNGDNTDGYFTCAAGQVCVGSLGECRPDNCVTFPDRCTESQTCVNGECVSNPCQGVTCDSGKYCLGGECVASCADVTCATGQRCRQGACETDPCGKPCPFGQACNDSTGQCIEDPCKFRDCPVGQWCNPNANTCEDDACVTSDVTCPNAGEVCRGGTCVDPDTLQVDAAGEAHVTVGGGGGCNTSGGDGGLLLALGALGLFVSRRRRTVGGAL